MSDERMALLPLIILEEETTQFLELQINQAILLGYRPLGPVQVTQFERAHLDDCFLYTVTMMYGSQLDEDVMKVAIAELEQAIEEWSDDNE